MDAVDVYVLLKVVVVKDKWTQSGLARDLGVSPSVVNRALKRAKSLKLYLPSHKSVSVPPFFRALIHGARYFLAPSGGGEVKGMPTAWAAPPLCDLLAFSDLLPPVWPDANGEMRGSMVEPLHPSAPAAAKRDPAFHELLALVDALRLGGVRERSLAAAELSRLAEYPL